MSTLKLSHLVLLLGISLEIISASRVLVLMPVGSKSHRMAFEPLFLELAKRGHEVTIVAYAIYDKSPNISNFREIIGPSAVDIYDRLPNAFADRLANISPDWFETMRLIRIFCEAYLLKPEVQDLIRNEKFDLVMIDVCNECAFGLAAHFNAPIIVLGTFPNYLYYGPHLGVPTLPSSTPYWWEPMDETPGFLSKVKHFYKHLILHAWTKQQHYEETQKYMSKLFPSALPLDDFFKNLSLVLHNAHRSMDSALLGVPGVVQVGGMHCKEGKPLPKELSSFLDESGSHGFIYMSMGSFIPGNTMPNETRNIFLSAFGKLKQRVLWKFESDMEGVAIPENVKLIRWAPQQDVLAHPKIKLFITQGGLPSTQEAIFHSVPILGVPLFHDQDNNVRNVKKRGAGLVLDLKDITEGNLLMKINEILKDPKFLANAKKLGEEFRENPMKPVDLAVYWTEYILRRGRNTNLFLNSRFFSTWEYYSLDVIFFSLGVVGVFLISFAVFLKSISTSFFNSKKLKDE